MTSRRTIRRVLGVGIALALPCFGAVCVHAGVPRDTTGAQVLLTWNAPAGLPRATTQLEHACGDTSRTDTLYICAMPGQDSPSLNGFTAEIRMRPAPGDSLADFWKTRRANGSLTRFEVCFAPDSVEGAPSPFEGPHLGDFRIDVLGDGVRIRMIGAVPANVAQPVRAGRIYQMAQVLVHRPPRGDAACAQPLCAQWVSGTLAFVMGYEPEVRAGQRFAALNGSFRSACSAWQRGVEAKPWTMPPRSR